MIAHRLLVVGTVGLCGALAFSATQACSASSEGDDGTGGTGASASGSSSGDGGMTLDGGTSDASGGACAADTYPGELVPLDLYVMLDKSASMQDSGKWSSVTTALTQFAQSPDSDKIGVGLQFFPLPPSYAIPGPCNGDPYDPVCGLYGPCVPIFNVCGGSMSNDSCDPIDYDEPDMPITELPPAEPTFTAKINGASPDGDSTPSQPAMEGAVVYATSWAQANPSHLTFIVFATDGDPTNCTYNSIQGTADAAQQAAGGNPPVKTFVIGVGSELGALNQVAQAGGTNQAYLVDTNQNVTQQFIDALNEIRAMGLCKFQIPVPQEGTPDYDKVNVSLVDPNDPDNYVVVGQVDNASSCHPQDGGWYYDDPYDPKMIVLCPATCDEVMLSDWDVSVLLGCQTVLL
ncbi:MAG: VWA domain-containing protein [Deltaproteobacteria bacterium]|nr:VWA domain-containing protein [Deltaproteobacteria bacterium]